MKVCEALLRGSPRRTVEHIVYLFDGFHLDVTRRRLSSSGGVSQSLNSRAMDALLLLVAHAGRVVEKRQLMEAVWPATVVEDNNLNQCILSIRKALGEIAGSNRYIMTVQGRGYCFVCPVTVHISDSDDEKADVPVSRARRLGLTIAALLPVSCVLLMDLLQQPARAPAVDVHAEPALVLRLRAAPGTGAMSPSTLASCLAKQPGMRLEVSVRLVSGGAGEALWSGQYVAGREDLLSLQEAAGNPAACPAITSR